MKISLTVPLEDLIMDYQLDFWQKSLDFENENSIKIFYECECRLEDIWDKFKE